MAKALDTLRQEHKDMAKLLRALEHQLEAFEARQTVDYEIVESVLDYSFAYPDLCHHPLEDLIYAKIRSRYPSALDLEEEHKQLAELTRKFSGLLEGIMQETPMPRDWFARTARNYINFARRHMEMEETYFFPVAEKSLTDEDWREIEARIDSTDNPLFSSPVQDRFRRLRDEILSWEDAGPPASSKTNA